ncbi:hypothetical protein DPMN_163922 [Dreissena polymorpha]|uniref:Uncharacterized protein n=1 Tax=Dreissena polymorpha TaxID=45954 RepID=A0A9D4EU88_DREPO|nr:hypothetical protein DPMN_163922 [Dreissena polymorpha]
MELTGGFAHLDPLAVLCPAPTRGLSGPLDTQQIFQYPATIKLIARNTKAAVKAISTVQFLTPKLILRIRMLFAGIQIDMVVISAYSFGVT